MNSIILFAFALIPNHPEINIYTLTQIIHNDSQKNRINDDTKDVFISVYDGGPKVKKFA